VPNIGADNFFNLSIPWNNNYTKANELFADLPGAIRVSKVEAADASLTDWFTGAPPAQNFDVLKSEGYLVRAGSSGVTEAVIVGSHDPNFTVDFTAGEFFNAASPYHQTFNKANELFTDLNDQLGSSAILRISKYETDASLTDWFTGAPPAQNFDLALGEAVLVRANDGGSGYVWPHY
jgi:hypothetical protein